MFLPLTKEEAKKKGWNTIDVVLVTGDAYVDHPSFGIAVIGRVLEKAGFSVGIIPMPNFLDPSSIEVFGRPNLFFGVTSGNIDSMLSRFTAFKKIRNDDPYIPGGKGGYK
ncbi:MAG: YgiQ family radical SAM protein, partial [Spirochaetota bacterium]